MAILIQKLTNIVNIIDTAKPAGQTIILGLAVDCVAKPLYKNPNPDQVQILDADGMPTYTITFLPTLEVQDFGGAAGVFVGTLDDLINKLNDEYFNNAVTSGGGGGGGDASAANQITEIAELQTIAAANLSAETTAFITTALLPAAATFTSPVLNAAGYSQVQTEILSSHDGTIDISFCADAGGTVVVRSLSIPYLASGGYQFFAAPAFANYIKYEFTNTAGVIQTDFYYTTKFLTVGLSPQLLTTGAFIAPAMVTSLGRNIIVGQNDAGQFKNVNVDNQNHLEVNASNPKTSYDELPVANYSPVDQITFPYNINTDIVNVIETAGGTVVQANNMAVLNTSATTASAAVITTIGQIPYRAGQGHICRFSCIFGGVPTVATAYIGAGIGDANDGYGFKKNNIGFNVSYRTDGLETNIIQSAWNIDKLDGSGPSGMTIDITKGNSYQIAYGSGFGTVNFSVESDVSGDYVLVHTLALANILIVPSAFNPTFPIRAEAANGAGTDNLTLSVAAISSFIEGKNAIKYAHGVLNSQSGIENGNFATEVEIITFFNLIRLMFLEAWQIIKFIVKF